MYKVSDVVRGAVASPPGWLAGLLFPEQQSRSRPPHLQPEVQAGVQATSAGRPQGAIVGKAQSVNVVGNASDRDKNTSFDRHYES
jgi:hypothetical protein